MRNHQTFLKHRLGEKIINKIRREILLDKNRNKESSTVRDQLD